MPVRVTILKWESHSNSKVSHSNDQGVAFHDFTAKPEFCTYCDEIVKQPIGSLLLVLFTI